MAAFTSGGGLAQQGRELVDDARGGPRAWRARRSRPARSGCRPAARRRGRISRPGAPGYKRSRCPGRRPARAGSVAASTPCRNQSRPKRAANRQTTTTRTAVARRRSELVSRRRPRGSPDRLAHRCHRTPALDAPPASAARARAAPAGELREPPRLGGGQRRRAARSALSGPSASARRRQGEHGRVAGLDQGHLGHPFLAGGHQLGLARRRSR